MATKQDIFTFKGLARIARQTNDPMDKQIALRFGIENRISNEKIRKSLTWGDFDW